MGAPLAVARVTVGATEAEAGGERLLERDTAGDAEAEGERSGEGEGVPLRHCVPVGSAVADAVPLSTAVPLALGQRLPLPLAPPLRLASALPEALREGGAEGVAHPVGASLRVPPEVVGGALAGALSETDGDGQALDE